MWGVQLLTHALHNLGGSIRHLQILPLRESYLFFALQMSSKHCIIVSSISVENGFKSQTTQSAKTLAVTSQDMTLTKYLQTIIMTLVLLTTNCLGQYRDNSPTLLKKLGVRSLWVATDSLKDGCPVDIFEYDPQGRELYHQVAMMEDRWENFYSNNSLTFSIWYVVDDNGKTTMLDSTFSFTSPTSP